MVIAVPESVIFEHELTRKWDLGVQRHESGPIELLSLRDLKR
jgi:hypothetical protein